MFCKNFLKISVPLLTGFISFAAHADFYMYIVNPDPSSYHIGWNGPGPNSIKAHTEFGQKVIVACWIVHDQNSHVPNAGITDNISYENVFWVEPKITGTPGFNKMQIQVDGGNPFMDWGDAQNTVWIGTDAAHTARVWDCG